MLTHPRPARPARFIQASQQPMHATWLEDPFWYFTHYVFVPGSRGQILPCVKRVRVCRWCAEADSSPDGHCRPRALHAAAAAVVQLLQVAPPIPKTLAQLITEFRHLAPEIRREYGYGSALTPYPDEAMKEAALKYAEANGTTHRQPPNAVGEGTTVQVVELLAAVADEIQSRIGDGVPWRRFRVGIRATRWPGRGLQTSVWNEGEADDVPDTFQGAEAFLDNLWAKYGVRAKDAT
jgi:hypothetical protein